MKPFPLIVSLLLVAACGSDLSGSCPQGRPILSARAATPTSVEITFACEVDSGSAEDTAHYRLEDVTGTLPAPLAVNAAAVTAPDRVQLSTAKQTGLRTYTLLLNGVKDGAGEALTASVNFVGLGQGGGAEVTFQVDDRYNENLKVLWLDISVDPLTGVFSHFSNRVALSDPQGTHIFSAKLKVAADPARTADTKDDRLGSQYMAYSVRAVESNGRALSKLVLFEVLDDKPLTVKVPLLSVPDKPPVEGRVQVTFKVDDRPARALSKPSLKASINTLGKFDASFPTTVALSDKDGDHIWEGIAQVWIDPSRVKSGTTASTQPYSVSLVESGTSYTARSADFEVLKEQAVTVSILVGNAAKVPVTFNVDVSKAWLDTTGQQKGVFSGEAVFLTGEFATAEDAFGQNASDAFSGGENVVLQMKERADRPGVWTRTIFLPKTSMVRPYGWKVVRCLAGQGCTQLNKMVSSSGRAFPTVMKNLATELCDLGKKTWTDKNCASPKLIDPRDLKKVNTGSGGILDYSSAKVWAGTGAGLKDQKDPTGTPKASLMFKQEIPDLVVNVKDKAVTTPAYVIGSWRDVNIPGTPKDIITGGSVLELTKTDYDAGLTGVLPPSYTLPPPAKPSPFAMDGKLDSTAKLVAGGSTAGGMPIYLALSHDHLYLATDDAGEGSDNFILFSATKSGALRPAPWGKAGKVALGGKTLFLADEDDSNFAGWFELGTGGGGKDKLLESLGSSLSPLLDVFAPATNGGYLEGTVDLKGVFGSVPSIIYLACAPWVSADKGKLYHAAQTPKTTNGDGNIDTSEILKVSLPSLKVLP